MSETVDEYPEDYAEELDRYIEIASRVYAKTTWGHDWEDIGTLQRFLLKEQFLEPITAVYTEFKKTQNPVARTPHWLEGI